MILKFGTKNDDVKKVQDKLGLPVDGIFGKQTENSVKLWQKAHNITPDGIVGSVTWKTLQESSDDTTQPETYVKKGSSDISQMIAKLKGHIPDNVLTQIPDCAGNFSIDSPIRLAHFIAQCSHESLSFKCTEENLNYSSASLKKVFGKYFRDVDPDKYARKPEMIASRVYANRMGNGTEASKEGYRYRGRGYIQLTGKLNYMEFNKSLSADIITNPDLVATEYALLSAAWYWNSRSLNEIADKGSDDSVVTRITKIINGGTNGLEDRIKRFNNYYELLC
jgi:putative chitinase